jgi:DNA polymerase-1
MIYLVTGQPDLLDNPAYKVITIEESLQLLNNCKILQFDSETSCKNFHLGKILCIQFGNKEKDFQIVIDCTTIDILIYKNILENTLLVGHNLKFDISWLYNYGIIPRKVYDTMIVEQLLYMGFPRIPVYPERYIKYEYDFPYKVVESKLGTYYELSFTLQALAFKYLHINIDKTVRGEIIWRGLDTQVILYSAGDVTYLEDIMKAQIKACKLKDCIQGAKLECDFVPVIAYLEWCGIKLDEDKWKAKMAKDKEALDKSLLELNEYAINHPKLQKWVVKELQGDLFNAFDLSPKWSVDWQKKDVIKVVKALGFDVSTISKQTNEESESVMEKVLISQKGIDDEFLKLFFNYQGYYKLCSSFGQGHLNIVNPKTGRIHSNYWQIGTISGRMSSGGTVDDDLAKYKNLPKGSCKNLNFQQLPHDAVTRGCFISEKDNVFVSCDYAAMEARAGAEVYNEKLLLDEFLYGSGDTHAAYAKVVFADELKDIDVKDIKKLRPDLRNKVKSVEFAVQFGSDGTAVAPQLGITIEEARKLVQNLLAGMKGLNDFKNKGSALVRKNGYVIAMPQTGHKSYWWDFKEWQERQKSFTSEFWEDYKLNHKGTNSSIAKMVKNHFKAASKYDRLALNIPTQGGGAVCIKHAAIQLFKWIIDNNYFKKVLIVNITHDEINSECPKELQNTYPNIVANIMEKTAAIYYNKLPFPAEASVGNHWIH